MAEDLIPWAIIIDKPAWTPNFELVSTPATIKPMCPIDEYAIIDFISDCRRQINDVITPPTIAIDMMGLTNILFIYLKIMTIRVSPYPPSFSKIAARIIDPATGASTWALGSHKWTENNGSFTKNAVIIIIQITHDMESVGIINCSGIVMFKCLDE